MRTTITTLTDLNNWLDAAGGSAGWADPDAPVGDPCGDSDMVLEGMSEVIRCMDHPDWGGDWGQFLSQLDLDAIQEEALRDMRPAGGWDGEE